MQHTVFQEPQQEKVWYSKGGRPCRSSDVAETRDPYEMASSLLPFPFPLTTSYCAGAIFKLKCVSRLRATFYFDLNYLTSSIRDIHKMQIFMR